MYSLGYFDLAQLALYAFWLFFFGLVYYLRREDKREGYPLLTDDPNRVANGFPMPPEPKQFIHRPAAEDHRA